jgi:putative hydrolase of the HAD superfamily
VSATIEAVLWDFGGVFTTSPFENFNKLEAKVGAPADFIRTLNSTNQENNAWAQFESSAVSLDEFDELFAHESEQMGHRIQGRDVIAMLSGSLRPRMVQVLKVCKQHYRVGCITNNVKAGQGPSMSPDQDKASAVAKVMQQFDVVVESSIEGIRKPNPQIYELACARLGVTAQNSVFLDDLGINLKPARALGMQTIKVLHETQAIDDLASITGLVFPA